MVKDLIIQDCHLPFRAPPLDRNGNVNHIRLIVVEDDGSKTLIYEGRDFNIEDWKTKLRNHGYDDEQYEEAIKDCFPYI